MNFREPEKGRALADASAVSKRPGALLTSPRRKRVCAYEPEQRSTPLADRSYHVRWLIESSLCARILGPGGKRFKHMKESTNEPNTQARISPKVPDAEYRVFNCSGTAMSISRMAGLLVRYIYDEPENEHSTVDSCRYDLKLLIPEVYVAPLVGSDRQNLQEIEERSNAALCVEDNCLPSSDEKCLHVFGVADAVQIAVYFTLETMRNVGSALSIPVQNPDIRYFDPGQGAKLDFKVGRQPDFVPRSRAMASATASSSFANERTGGANANGSSAYYAPDNASSSNGESNSGAKSETATKDNLKLPQLAEDPNLPQSIYTAYDIARDSKRSHLRQIVQIGSARKGSDKDLAFLIENIRRVTTCHVEQGVDDAMKHFDETNSDDVSLIIDGPPEENSLALLLIFRFLKRNSTSDDEQDDKISI